MKKVLQTLRAKGGFISFETVVVAALMIGLGVFAITSLIDGTVPVVNGMIDEHIIPFFFIIENPGMI
ncbi:MULTISPECIES: hypothetical protein [unclassified Psychrobacillus]|uniref:hypothetical protein n=1 Tax=unclassified Psychrobacillus TaxID=2636677 RepID=UPI0030FBDF08